VLHCGRIPVTRCENTLVGDVVRMPEGAIFSSGLLAPANASGGAFGPDLDLFPLEAVT
jgi:hypothetical protein